MMKWRRELLKAQWLEPDVILTWQSKRLQRLVRTAYEEVPFYRRLMDQAKVYPGDILSRKDLVRIPPVRKEMLRGGVDVGAVRDTGQRTYLATTSGSTGLSFQAVEDAESAGYNRAAFLVALDWAGWRLGEKHIQFGMNTGRSPSRRIKDWVMGCRYFSAYDLTDAALDRILAVLAEQRIQHVWGYPAALWCLSRRAKATGLTVRLRTVVSWGDMLFSSQRLEIEGVFGVKVTDTYGCGEGIQIAAQCGTDGGYHIHDLNTIVELVDDDENPVSPGQPGHVLLTRLHPGPMPFLRYRVGDMAVADDKPCSCGRGFSRLRRIEGRSADMITTPGGNRLVIHFFTGVLENIADIDAFQVRQLSEGELGVQVVPKVNHGVELEKRVRCALQEKGLTDMNIIVDLVEAIPLSPGGKRRLVLGSVDGAS